MKNIIEIDALNNCTCDLISCINDGTARIFLNIYCDVSLNPKLEIAGGGTITITENNFLYELSSSLWTGTGTLQFRIVDDSHTGNYFNIAKIASYNKTLNIKQNSNFEFVLSCKKEESVNIDPISDERIDEICTPVGTEGIIPIASKSNLGCVIIGDGINVRNDGTVWVEGQAIDVLTNLEIDQICV